MREIKQSKRAAHHLDQTHSKAIVPSVAPPCPVADISHNSDQFDLNHIGEVRQGGRTDALLPTVDRPQLQFRALSDDRWVRSQIASLTAGYQMHLDTI